MIVIDWSYAIMIVVIGFSLVIALLTGLAGIMVLIERAHDRGIKGILEREAPVEEVSEEELSSDEVVAILGAVLGYMRITKEKAPVPKSQKWVLEGRKNFLKTLNRETPSWGKDKSSMWKFSGRRELMNSKGTNLSAN